MVRRVKLAGATVEFTDEAPTAAGRSASCATPVVLLHGFTGSKDSWLHLRAALRANGYRVVAIDLPGHGGTTVEGGAAEYSMERAAAMVVGVVTEALGIPRFHLLGYSMGGRLALYIALEYGALVESLVLESASAGIADSVEREARRRADEELAAFAERIGPEDFVNYWQRLPLFDSLTNLPSLECNRLRSQRLSCSAEGLAKSLCGMGSGAQPWLGDKLGELRMPVLVAAGVRDHKFVEIGQRLLSAIARATFTVVDNVGHMPHLERPSEFNRIVVKFLDDAG